MKTFIPNRIVISISGGKDSSVLMQYAVDNFPREKLVCVHAQIDIDWTETLGVVRAQCAHFNLPLVIVQAVDKNGATKGFLDQLTAPRVNRKTGETGEYKFPSMGQRWCTSVLKTAPIDKYVRTLGGNVLVLIGERREESPNRAKLEAWRPDDKNSTAGRTVVKCSPILDMTAAEVWAVIEKNGIPKHPCYGWGVSRASCAICIFSSNAEIRLAAKHAPEIVAKYVEAEKKIQHSFRFKRKTKNRAEVRMTVADILATEGE